MSARWPSRAPLLRANPPTSERRARRAAICRHDGAPSPVQVIVFVGRRLDLSRAIVLVSERSLALSFTRAPPRRQRQLLAVPTEPSALPRVSRRTRARARVCKRARVHVLRPTYYACSSDATGGRGNAPRSVRRKYQQRGWRRCAVVIARSSIWESMRSRYALPAGGCVLLVIHRRNVHRQPSAPQRPFADALRATIRRQSLPCPPSLLFLRIRRPIYRCAWPNPVAGEALVVFPQIRCSPRCPGGEVCQGGSHCGGDLRRGV